MKRLQMLQVKWELVNLKLMFYFFYLLILNLIVVVIWWKSVDFLKHMFLKELENFSKKATFLLKQIQKIEDTNI